MSSRAAPSGVPKPSGPKMPNRIPGAPPGIRPSHGRGPPGKPSGIKPGFANRGPSWVIAGSSGAASTSPSTSMDTHDSGLGDGLADATKSDIGRRKEKQYDQADIAPTAQSMGIDPLNLAHPMTLPFLDPVKANPTLAASQLHAGTDKNGIRRPVEVADHKPIPSGSVRAMGTEAERSNPANLMFRNENGEYEGEDQLFFIQMPSALPLGEAPVRPSSATEQTQVLGFKGNLPSLPAGNIGKLLIYKSGKVKLKVGEVLFDVSTGMPCNFLQEVVAIDMDKQKYYQLGDISRRMVCYPDVESLLEQNSQKSASNSMDLT